MWYRHVTVSNQWVYISADPANQIRLVRFDQSNPTNQTELQSLYKQMCSSSAQNVNYLYAHSTTICSQNNFSVQIEIYKYLKNIGLPSQ